MKLICIVALLSLCSCYHMRNARFSDESESTAKIWACASDTDPTNPGGIECVDMASVLEQRERNANHGNAGPRVDL